MVIVDEASMVDLALMAKLIEALPPQAKLVLVGDKDQLASVEAGSVLGDICGGDGGGAEPSEALRRAAGPASGLKEAIVELRRSYRFAEGSPIGELSRAVNRGDARAALDVMSSAAGAPLQWWDPDRHPGIEQRIEGLILEGGRGCGGRPDPEAALHSFGRFRILCALRAGPQGVAAFNRMAERALLRSGLIRAGGLWGGLWYPGRPVLITRNDYAVNLYNGDVGIALTEASGGRESLMVFFQGPSGSLRRLPPHRLGEHETAYAMTVHKSQGSEFDDVLLVLPDRDSPVLTRELIYTALTRSRRSITIRARKPVLLAAIGRRIERASGLRSALWGG
jgi:exodeoxyribonuclease V alpha subunit